jgi:hypothetical protein
VIDMEKTKKGFIYEHPFLTGSIVAYSIIYVATNWNKPNYYIKTDITSANQLIKAQAYGHAKQNENFI